MGGCTVLTAREIAGRPTRFCHVHARVFQSERAEKAVLFPAVPRRAVKPHVGLPSSGRQRISAPRREHVAELTRLTSALIRGKIFYSKGTGIIVHDATVEKEALAGGICGDSLLQCPWLIKLQEERQAPTFHRAREAYQTRPESARNHNKSLKFSLAARMECALQFSSTSLSPFA